MNYMLCRNRVSNFEKWKSVFDSHASAHRDSGLRVVNLWRGVDEPDNVFFLFEVADLQKAREFISNPKAKAAGAESGVVDGDYHFVEGSI